MGMKMNPESGCQSDVRSSSSVWLFGLDSATPLLAIIMLVIGQGICGAMHSV